MLREILFVGLGSFAGGALRYVIAKLMNGGFPWGTFLVNIAGCLFIGLLYGLFDKANVSSPEIRLLLTVGFCGGFTTFSAFINENLMMLQSGDIVPFSLYVSASVILGLAAVWFGYWLLKVS